jgi:ribosomal protein L11 methyltransferase
MTQTGVVELRIVFKKDLPAAREILGLWLSTAGISCERRIEQEGLGKSLSSVSVYFPDRTTASGVLRQLQQQKFSHISSSLHTHRRQDWESAWKKGWKPFSLTRRFHIIPLWQEDRLYPAGKVPVFLDTTNAFGTGLHETTRFTAQIIDQLSGTFSSFLDIGTGSGILAVVAARLGASRVLAFDIDPDAVSVAKANLAANNLSLVTVRKADIARFVPRKLFDCVAANLVTPDLLRCQESIAACVAPGGHLVVSGISLASLPLFSRSFSPEGFSRVRLVKGKEWAAVLFRRHL